MNEPVSLDGDARGVTAAYQERSLTSDVPRFTFLTPHYEVYAGLLVVSESKPIRVRVPDGLEELVPEYLTARRQDAVEMSRFLSDGQFDQVRILAHNLKGNGACYGFSELSRLGAALEAASKRLDCKEAAERLVEIKCYLDEVEIF